MVIKKKKCFLSASQKSALQAPSPVLLNKYYPKEQRLFWRNKILTPVLVIETHIGLSDWQSFMTVLEPNSKQDIYTRIKLVQNLKS